MSKYKFNARATKKMHKLVDGPLIPELHHFEDKDLNESVASRTVFSDAKNRQENEEYEAEYGRVPLSLDLQGINGKKMVFDGKGWSSTEDKTLFEENNMLKFKMEVLLDLYASTRSDYLRMKEQVKKLEAYNESQQAHR
eukprot:m.420175 g.420175  ORF g.420175 m.420175 type:complete len:139 (+) comp32267_c0_seq1:105-521(+)